MGTLSTSDDGTARVGVFPGSFNPLTIAHLAIADAFRLGRRLTTVHLSMSRVALAKEDVSRPLFDHRVEVLKRTATRIAWLDVVVTDKQLLADIAEGYDSIVMGADKWHQIHDVRFYGDSAEARDQAVKALPDPALVDRPPLEVPDGMALDIPEQFADVSSSATRAGRREWMVPEAAEFDELSGAWTDPKRYETFLADPSHFDAWVTSAPDVSPG